MRSSEVRRMPFDGIDAFDNQPIAKLGAVERMLATEQQWCKGRLRDAHGRHCLVGAIEAVGGRQVLQKPILQAAREVSGKRYWRIEFFNDDPRTTHADVLQVLRRTRENMIDGMICSFARQPWHRRWMGALRAAGLAGRLRRPGDFAGEHHPLFAQRTCCPVRRTARQRTDRPRAGVSALSCLRKLPPISIRGI